jgi:N-acetyl sugar amidotransferase
MKYCQRCLYPENHPLGLVFDAEGICSGCRVHEEKYELDWTQRERRLAALLDGLRNQSGSGYDCVVPVSGARDSYFIVHTLKRRYGMNPLLVSYNRHFNTERGIRNLAYLRTWFDCDYMQMVVSPRTIKRITRETLRRMGSMYWHVLAGQSVWPVQVAVRLKIPLVVWGAHQGLDQVGMFSHADEVEMSRKYRCEHDLIGVEAEDLIGGSENLRDHELRPFFYPHNRELSAVGVRGIYLGNFIPWDSKAQHEQMIRDYGYETAALQRTFDTYNDVDCQHYAGLHDWIKFAKWGYGKVSDHASREIRLRRMTREQGIDLVGRYRDVAPADKQAFLSWVEMGEGEFDALIDAHRDPRIWLRSETGAWQLLDCVSEHRRDPGAARSALELRENSCEFGLTPSRDPQADEHRYVLMARGYSDNHRVRP